MRYACIIVVLFATLVFPRPTPAQNGCAAPTTVAQPAQAPPVADGSVGLTRLSAVGGAVMAAARADDTLYVAQGGLLRIERPGSGTIQQPLSDLARDLAVSATGTYVAAGSAGLIGLPVGGTAVTLPLPGLASGVTVVGTRAYVAAAGADGGLHIVDVAAPAQPRLLGTAAVLGSASAVTVAGDLAYVAGGVNGGIEIFNLADPAAPVRLGGLITPGAARSILLVGERAYVAAGICGLQTLDVSDPADPRLLGAVATGGEALDLALAGTVLYVAAGAGGIAGFDLSTGTPQPLAQTTLPGFARQLSLSGAELLIAAEAGGLFALTLSPPAAAPRAVAAGDVPLALVRDAERVFLGLRQGGVREVDLTDPAQPDLLSRWEAPTAVRALALATPQDRLYAAVDDVGIVTLAVNEPDPPTELNRLAAPGQVTALLFDPDAAQLYAAVGSAGVAIYTLSDPDAPELLRTIDTPGTALGLAQRGDLLLVADRSGLQLIDLSTNTLQGTFTPPAGSFVQGVAVAGTTALLADRTGLLVIEISDPAVPRQVGMAGGFTAYNVLTEAERVYVAAGPAGVLVFDIVQPTQPHLVSAFPAPGSTLDLTLAGDQVAVANEAGGLLILTSRDLPNRLMLPLIGRSGA